MPTISNLVWHRSGGEIWFAAEGEDGPDGVYAVTLEGAVRHVYSAPGYATVADLAANGDALFVMVSPRMRMETSTRAGGRAAAVDLTWLDWSLLRDLSADGTMVLFDETGFGSGGTPGVYIRPVDGGPAVRLGDGICSAISGDGRFVLTGEIGGRPYFNIVPIGAGELRRVPTGDLHPAAGAWLPGGREVILIAAPRDRGRGLHRVDLESGSIHPLQDGVTGTHVIVSPDGTQVLSRGEDGALALFPLDGGPSRPFPGLDLMWRPAGWAADSRSFFAYRGGVIPAPVVRVDAAGGAAEPWAEIFTIERSGTSGINSMRFSQDGERYVCSYPRIHSVLFHARGLR